MCTKPQVHDLPNCNNITVLEFSAAKELLLAGDSQGRVHVYYTRDSLCHFTSFMSHTSTFDSDSNYYESESLTSLAYAYHLPKAFAMISANEKTVRLWTVDINEPQKQRCRLRFGNAHDFRVHSVSMSMSKQQFLSCDDLRINLWDINHQETAYCVVDMKPSAITTLREVLLYACFHHTDSALIVYTSTNGTIRIGDLRTRAKALPAALEMRRRQTRRSHYSDILSSVTGADFNDSGTMLFARDILDVCAWDLRNPSSPVSSVSVIPDERHLFGCANESGVVDKFQVKSTGANRCVTGGLECEVVIASDSGERETQALKLGPWNLPHVTCDPQGDKVFVGVKNKVAVTPGIGQNGSQI